MRKTALLLASAVAALATAGIAVAHYTTSGTTVVGATFGTTAKEAETRTCVGSDGDTYEITRGRYVGTSESATPALKGEFQAHVKAVYNVTDKNGWITGWIKVRNATDGEHSARAGFSATLGDLGAFDGFASGRAGHDTALFANISGTFNKDTGFAGGKIGGGAAGAGLAVLSGRACHGGKPGNAAKLEVKGVVTGLDAGKITVTPPVGSGQTPAPQTCIIPAGFTLPQGIVVNTTMVEIYCGQIGADMTLLKIRVKEQKPGAARLEVKGVVEKLVTFPATPPETAHIIVKPRDGSASQRCEITTESPTIPANLIALNTTKVEMYCATLGTPGVLTLVKLKVYDSN